MVLSMPPTTSGETESLARLNDLLQVELGGLGHFSDPRHMFVPLYADEQRT